MGLSVGVGRVDVFGQSLLIVTVLAERLPVVLVPEKFLVTTVWNDVIHNRCPDEFAVVDELTMSAKIFAQVIVDLCC